MSAIIASIDYGYSTSDKTARVHNSKDSTGPQRLLRFIDATTCSFGFGFEEVSAFVFAGTYERQVRSRS